MFSLIGIGFTGAIISACIAAAIYGDYPSIGSIIIMASFGFVMISPLIFCLYPFRKTVTTFNNIILNEFGTVESKAKTYELYFSGFEIVEQDNININSKWWRYLFLRYVPRISKIFFSPSGFYTKNDFPSWKGITSFLWENVGKIIIDTDKKQIGILLNSYANVFLPLQKNIYYLIKTFCSVQIENEDKIYLMFAIK